MRVGEDKADMQNLILFQAVTKWDGEFGSQLHEKLKNKQNYIAADEFTFKKFKIFLMKSFSSE